MPTFLLHLSSAFAVTVTAAVAAPAWPAAEDLPVPIVLNDNGAWSFFEDERAVVDARTGTLLVSSVAHGNGSGGDGRHGDVEVVRYDLESGETSLATIADRFEADDHDSAALFLRPDGRYLAMYSRHGSDSLSRWRVSTRTGDATEWDTPRALDNGAPTSYSNVYAVPDENDGRGRLYAFTRTKGWDPHFLVSDDDGSTWSRGGRLLDGPGRPYLRYAADGAGRIHVLATEQHPDDFANGIYHGIIEREQLRGSKGELVDRDLFDGRASAPEKLSRVFDSDGDERAWAIDVAIDASGNPYGVFSVRSTDEHAPGGTRRRYLTARFDGDRWRVSFLAHAGSALYDAQPSYTGLVALHPTDPNRVFVSTDVHPATGIPLVSARDRRQHHELFEGRTHDDGATWSWTPLTNNSSDDNIRPIVPPWDSDDTIVLWLRGTYTTFRDYDLQVVGLIRGAPCPA